MHCERISSYEIGENRNLHTQLTVKGITYRNSGYVESESLPEILSL
jgi:hypothetical protein